MREVGDDLVYSLAEVDRLGAWACTCGHQLLDHEGWTWCCVTSCQCRDFRGATTRSSLREPLDLDELVADEAEKR